MVSLVLIRYLIQKLLHFDLEGRLIEARRVRDATQLVHPEIWGGRVFVPVSICIVQQIDILCCP